MRKNTATPTSSRAANMPSEDRKSNPVTNATCVVSTASAAIARSPSKQGKRGVSVPIRAGLPRPPASVMGGDATDTPRC